MDAGGTRRGTYRADSRQVWALLAVFIIVLLLWNTIFIAPLKILVVFFHELSHGLAAIFSGGRIHGIELNARQGGLTITSGGNALLITSAGYIGSMLWGGLLILSSRFIRRRQLVTFLLGLLLVGSGLFFVRPVISFGFIFCMLTGALLLYLSSKAADGWQDFLLKLIGVTSCMYAVLDIKSDVLDRPHMHSDAVAMQQQTFIPSIIWGIIWIAMAIACTWYCLRIAVRHDGRSTDPMA